VNLSVLNTWALSKQRWGWSERFIWKVEETVTGGIGLRATFLDGQSHHLFFKDPHPAFWLLPTVPNSWCQNLEFVTFKEDEKDCIRVLLSNWQTSFRFLVIYFFLCLQRALTLVWILSHKFFSHNFSFATLSKPSSFITDWFMLWERISKVNASEFCARSTVTCRATAKTEDLLKECRFV